LPGTNGDVTDLLTYTVRDVRSAYRAGDTVRTATSSILVSIAPDSTNQTQNIVGISTLPNGSKQISFAGIPGYSYRVQAADNLTPPVAWQTLATNVAGTNGLWSYTDLDATNHPSRFYRTAQP
jgi:hypothetical protein